MQDRQPYRSLARSAAEGPGRRALDGLELALRVATALLVFWSLLRVAVCSFQGLDFEGFLALAIVVTAVQSLTSRSPSS